MLDPNHLQDIVADLCKRISELEKIVNQKTRMFNPPTLQEVSDYCRERQNSVNPVDFVNHYTANNWYRGKTKIKDWRACVRTWEKNYPKEAIDQQSWI